MTRESDRELLERFARGTAPTRTVLLVRHGSAGSSAEWAGDDRERPLDDCGIAQADELVHLLSRSRSARSSPPTSSAARRASSRWLTPSPSRSSPSRCCPRSPIPGREEEAVALVRRLGDAEHDAVACSQGELVPDLVDAWRPPTTS